MGTRHPTYFPALTSLVLVAACTQQPAPTSPSKSSAFDRVEVQGGALEYRVTGRGEPVLLIHGSIFADVFDGVLNEPAFANHQLITYHRRGFAGSTRAPSPFTMPAQAADVIALLDKLKVRRAHLVGHSYGGSVALQVARQYPQRVASLVLLEAAMRSAAPPDPKMREGVSAAMALHAQGDARGAIIRFANTVAPGSWDEMTAAGATAMQNQGIADAATFFDIELPALMQWQFSEADLAALRVPALVVMGEASRPARARAHAALLRGLPQAEELVVPGVGHELQMKQPRVVSEAIAAFLRKHRM